MENYNLNQPDPKAEKDEKERKDYGTLNDPSIDEDGDKSAIAQNEDDYSQDTADENYDNAGVDEGQVDEDQEEM